MKRIIRFIFIGLLITLVGCASTKVESKDNEVTIGYFPNLTHIVPIVALEKGYFKAAYGDDISVKTKTFNDGSLFMEAMTTNAIDIGTTGPGPILNIYAKDPSYHIISGSVNGGAVLVATKKSGIKSVKDLNGKQVAIPSLGNTQDLSIRKELGKAGLKPIANGGKVELFPTAPADTLAMFRQNSIDAAAVPEPWGHILETEEKAISILDWKSFGWGAETPVTVVGVTKEYAKNKKGVDAYLTAHTKAVKFINENPEEAKELYKKHLKQVTSKEIDQAEIDAAFERIEVTTDINEKVIQEMADVAKSANYIQKNDVKGLVNLEFSDN